MSSLVLQCQRQYASTRFDICGQGHKVNIEKMDGYLQQKIHFTEVYDH